MHWPFLRVRINKHWIFKINRGKSTRQRIQDLWNGKWKRHAVLSDGVIDLFFGIGATTSRIIQRLKVLYNPIIT